MTHIWVPSCKILEPKREIVLPHRMAGFFKLEAIRPNGRRRLLADWFPNLVTDYGLNDLGTNANTLTNCRVGTGNATPDVADTALAAQIASTANVTSSTAAAQGSPPYYGSRTNVYRFSIGAAEGILAEVGIAPHATDPVLFSRALILDGGGSPTTVEVLSDEALDVTYQLRCYPPTADVETTIDIGGVTYDLTIRAASVTSTVWSFHEDGERGGCFMPNGSQQLVYNGAIGAVTGLPSGSSGGNSSRSDPGYGNNDLYRDGLVSWGLTFGNLAGGITAAHANFGSDGNFGRAQFGFDPAIPKDNTKVLSLVFRHSWARKTI